MRRAICLVTVLLLSSCSAFRLLQGEQPQEGGERHIQYLAANKAGISDRLTILSRLMWMGWRYNATVHFPGGESTGPTLYYGHSKAINAHWSHYVDIPGACNGRTPFHNNERMENCVTISDLQEDFLHLFQHGERCVQIATVLYHFRKLFPTTNRHTGVGAHDNPPAVTDPTCDVPKAFSPAVRTAADDFLKRYNVPPGNFAAMHIRRCDRKYQNDACTVPSAVFETVNSTRDASTWILFTYAEPGYASALKNALQPLRGKKRILLEDEITINRDEPDDNYFTYMVAMRLMAMAKVSIDTQGCAFGKKVCR